MAKIQKTRAATTNKPPGVKVATKSRKKMDDVPKSERRAVSRGQKLRLYVSEIEELVHRLDKKTFKKYLSDGVPQDVIDDLEYHTAYSGPIIDESTTITVNDDEVPGISGILVKLLRAQLNETSGATAKKSTPTTRIEYALVSDRWIKRSLYELHINGPFDPKKLSVDICREAAFGQARFDCLATVSYDAREFEFKEHWGTNSESTYLRTSRGGCHEVNVLGSDDDDDLLFID